MNKITKQELLEKSQLIPEFDSDFVFEDEDQVDEIFTDDGSLHIRVDGTRVCFEIGQDVSPKQFREVSTRIQETLFGEVISKDSLKDC